MKVQTSMALLREPTVRARSNYDTARSEGTPVRLRLSKAAKKTMQEALPSSAILCTHPMFGPESGKLEQSPSSCEFSDFGIPMFSEKYSRDTFDNFKRNNVIMHKNNK